MSDIEQLERQWASAAAHYSPSAWPAERAAWDAMVEAKRAANLCIDPGCRTIVELAERCAEHPDRGESL